MTSLWEKLGNCPSEDLREVWGQICQTFNEQAEAADNKWRVLQPATGTGKSQGLALYSALHKHDPSFGILIVVRLIEQADEMARTINKLADVEMARARHSDSVLSADEMAETQVLVVTHKAYELSLDAYTQGCTDRFSSFLAYAGSFDGRRQLVVIDESLDVVKHYQVDLDFLSQAIGQIPSAIKHDPRFSGKVEHLKALEAALEVNAKSTDTATRGMNSVAPDLPEGFDLSDLRKECRKYPWDRVMHGRESTAERSKTANRIDKTLEAAEMTLNQWSYYSKAGERHTVNTSSLVLPDEARGAVVMDATASQNLLYRLFADKVIIQPVLFARRYGKVTLHVAKVKGIGKTAMTKRADKRLERLRADLVERISPDSLVCIVTHKIVEAKLAAFEMPFKVMRGHWGALDGKNNYQYCDTFVCVGLPFRDRITSSNVYCAIKGPQSDAWLQATEKRADGIHTDIRTDIEDGQLAADVIQAMNRIQIRRVVDEHGNCETSHCYIVLGDDKRGDRLLDSIKKAMPGIRVVGMAARVG
tara:strand:+ start:2456 stop:4051 length:1596 start_codon:yes stop_codon:yes gene_type:complete